MLLVSPLSARISSTTLLLPRAIWIVALAGGQGFGADDHRTGEPNVHSVDWDLSVEGTANRQGRGAAKHRHLLHFEISFVYCKLTLSRASIRRSEGARYAVTAQRLV